MKRFLGPVCAIFLVLAFAFTIACNKVEEPKKTSETPIATPAPTQVPSPDKATPAPITPEKPVETPVKK